MKTMIDVHGVVVVPEGVSIWDVTQVILEALDERGWMFGGVVGENED